MRRNSDESVIVRNDNSSIIVILSILVWVALLIVPRFIPAFSEALISFNSRLFRVGFFDVLGISILFGAFIVAQKDVIGRRRGFDPTTLIVAAMTLFALFLLLAPFAPGFEGMRQVWNMGFTTGIGWAALLITGLTIASSRS